MSQLENHGLIIRQLRLLKGLSVRNAAIHIGKSIGWLSEIENSIGTARLRESEFHRIVDLLDGKDHRPMFRTWVANHKNLSRINHTMDGAVLKFIRKKKELTLIEAATKIGLSAPYVCCLETGRKPINLRLRNKILAAYGYSPASFKNFSTDPARSKVVPKSYKLKILMQTLSSERLEEIFNLTLPKNQ